jgi:hypothetical protein
MTVSVSHGVCPSVDFMKVNKGNDHMFLNVICMSNLDNSCLYLCNIMSMVDNDHLYLYKYNMVSVLDTGHFYLYNLYCPMRPYTGC